tara:strand:+ start:3979 stop:4347 length:369 start_codon:yes stop_codon:yes gene_type:complete
MKTVINLLIVIIALLSLAAGIAKVTHSPQEVQFLQGFMFNDFTITLFGVIQVLAAIVLSGGALFTHKAITLVGAITVALCLLLSSILIFVSGNWVFGLLSLLPVALTGLIIKQISKLAIKNT